jgi:hypothetical protein
VAETDLSGQFHYWPNGDAWDAWSIPRLIHLAEGLPTEEVPLEAIAELDTNYWFHAGHEPTVRNVVHHVRHAMDGVDPRHPVILGPDDRVMDGMHRITRALVEGRTHVTAVRLDPLPPPDVTGCRLGEA